MPGTHTLRGRGLLRQQGGQPTGNTRIRRGASPSKGAPWDLLKGRIQGGKGEGGIRFPSEGFLPERYPFFALRQEAKSEGLRIQREEQVRVESLETGASTLGRRSVQHEKRGPKKKEVSVCRGERKGVSTRGKFQRRTWRVKEDSTNTIEKRNRTRSKKSDKELRGRHQ